MIHPTISAEQSVLGCLLIRPDAFDRIDWLQAEHFIRDDHRVIFTALRKLIEAGKPVDPMLCADALSASGDLHRAGGTAYLLDLQGAIPSAHNIDRYAEIVRDASIIRLLDGHACEISAKAKEPGVSPQELAEHAEALFTSVLAPQSEDSMRLVDAVEQALDWEDKGIKGLSTGFPSLDRILGGLRPEELIIIAGRPAMGKSVLAQCIAEHVAKEQPVYFCSLEMSARQIGARSLAYHGPRLGLNEAVAHIGSLSLRIDARSPLTLGGLRMRLRRHKRRYGLSLLVVDYLQLMQGPRSDNRHQEIGAISRGLKTIAKEFGIPVIAVASLNRQAEGRTDKRPVMSDLKESGDIESDADIVAMVYREEVYNPSTVWTGIGEVIIRKHREGPIGTAYLQWIGEQTRFTHYAGQLPQDEAPKPKQRADVVVGVDWKRRSGSDE